MIPRFRIAALALLVVGIKGFHPLDLARIQSPHTDLEGGTILLGALAAVLLSRPAVRAACVRWLRPWAVLPLVMAVWIALAHRNSSYNFLIFALTLPLLIVSTMLHPESATGRILETQPAKFVGRISYSLYLWQQMFFARVDHWLPEQHRDALTWIQHSWARYLLLPVIAIASYYWV